MEELEWNPLTGDSFGVPAIGLLERESVRRLYSLGCPYYADAITFSGFARLFFFFISFCRNNIRYFTLVYYACMISIIFYEISVSYPWLLVACY